MSNYLKVTNFAVKDGLTTGDPNKIVKGAEINFEFDAIQTAVNGKADLESPVFTGAPKAPTAPLGTETTQIASTLFVKQTIDANNEVGTLGTQDKDAVDITGGTIVGLTQLEIDASAQAGTQASLDVPSRTGAGASGSWAIDITGSPASISTAVVNAAIAGSTSQTIGTYSLMAKDPGSGTFYSVGLSSDLAVGEVTMRAVVAPGFWRAMGLISSQAYGVFSAQLYVRVT
jgi:hypothetical protein